MNHRVKPNTRQGQATTTLLAAFLLVLFFAVLPACQQGNGTGTQSDGQGTVTIGLTDAAGDLSTYAVDLVSLTLKRQDGAIVEALPNRTTVDFAQYTQLTEFLTVATVPAGRYVEASLKLDYGNADIRAEDQSGQSIPVTRFVDEQDQPVGIFTASVHLDGKDSLLVLPGGPAHMTLDFDLASSNRVSFDSSGIPTLHVAPFLVADVLLDKPKVHRVRGPLKSVDVAQGKFTTILHPFRHQLKVRHERFGLLTVDTDDQTRFEIDHETFIGLAGLERLAAMPALTAVTAIGDIMARTREMKAREVYAGDSVPGGDLDALAGTVIARQGDRLTVQGAVLTRKDGSFTFNDRLDVILSATTRVRKQFSSLTATIADISVGQRIRVFGTIDTATAPGTLDARQGYVRMLMTDLRGSVIGMASIPELTPPFVVNLQRINQRPLSLFNFSGTGRTPAEDANPNQYQIDTGVLDPLNLADGTPVELRGFVSPFGQAAPDFEARSIIDLSAVRARMAVSWAPPTTAAFRQISVDGIVPDLAGSGRFHHVARGIVITDLTTQSTDSTMLPPADGQGVYVIKIRGKSQVSMSFNDFVAALNQHLASGDRVRTLQATGEFDDRSLTLTATRITIQLLSATGASL